jgi:hypothetical protein
MKIASKAARHWYEGVGRRRRQGALRPGWQNQHIVKPPAAPGEVNI